MLELHNTINMHKKDKWMYLLQDSKITKFFLDSAEVEGDLNLANNSWIKVLSSFNIETTYKRTTQLEAK